MTQVSAAAMPCAHCANPTAGDMALCRYKGSFPSRTAFLRSTFDPPCALDAFDRQIAENGRCEVRRILAAVVLVILIFVACVIAAEARPKQVRGETAVATDCVSTAPGREVCPDASARASGVRAVRAAPAEAYPDAVIVGGRPPGCPHRFCGCEASLYLFGKIIKPLNLAANWKRYFPRARPAPGMVAARSGHVFVLMSHVEGKDWLVHDGNSGGGKTRRHVRSIAGYTIVDPNARVAGL